MTVQTRRDPDARGYFGEFGGRFVPETLVEPVEELERAYLAARDDAAFHGGAGSAADALRRPADARYTRRARLTEAAGGARIFLKREDLTHTGAHKINNALGQALLAVRMGKRRIVAETGAGQHGVATATACALLGLECHVYMGAEDMERQALNVFRMRLLGAEVLRVDAGSRTLKDAINEAMRDWVTNVGDTYYLLGSVLGPHPYPLMVREFQAVIGREARAQILELAGRLPDAVVACVGGGSNAMGIFDAFIDDRDVRLIGVEAGGERIARGPPRGAIRRRQRRRPAGHAHLRAAGRGRQHRADAFDLGRPRLRGGRAGARVAAGAGADRVRARQRRRGARGVSDAGAARRHPAGARVGARDRVRADARRRARTATRSCS